MAEQRYRKPQVASSTLVTSSNEGVPVFGCSFYTFGKEISCFDHIFPDSSAVFDFWMFLLI